MPSHTARSVDQDLTSAGIPKQGPGGKIDFHAIRKAYINLVIESGVTVKEAQALARHASPVLTMNVYGHAREDRLAAAVERVAEVVLPVKRVPVEYQQAVGAETKIATPIGTEGCDNKNNGGGGGNRTRRNQKHHRHNRATFCRKFLTKQRIAALANLYQTT